MTQVDRKALKRAYLQQKKERGVYAVCHAEKKTAYVGASLDIRGAVNGCLFQLRCGSHPCMDLQADFTAANGQGFAVQTLEILPYAEQGEEPPTAAIKEDLACLRDLWRDKLRQQGYALYTRGGEAIR